MQNMAQLEPGPICNSVLTQQQPHRSTQVWKGSRQINKSLKCCRYDRSFWNAKKEFDDRVMAYIQLAGFDGMSRLERIHLDWPLITAMVERWRPETHCFQLPFGEVTITLQDVEVLLGLRIDGMAVTSVQTRTKNEWCDICHDLLGIRPNGANGIENPGSRRRTSGDKMRIIMITWIPMVLLFSNLFTINVMHTLGQCLPDQKSVFLHIRSELTYNSLTSTKLVLWDERVDCCQWPGLSCNDSGYITSLDLSDDGSIIAGFNVSLLLKLPSLSVIRLDGIAFSAPFPDFFADFTNLTVLSLAGCNFSGTVPQKVFQVPTLQTIDLSFNEMLGGSLPDFPKNGSLKSLTLYGTMFSGNLPESIGNLRLLSHLDLAYCDFSGAISVSITKLTNLVGLRLHGNHFSGWIPPLKLVKNLTYINLSNNDFTGEIPSSHWDGLNNLKNLDLSENSFSGPIPASLFFLPSLTTLSLYGNKLSGHINELQNVTSALEVIHFSGNNLEGTIPSFFFQLQNLSALYLSSNKFSGQMIDLQNVTSPLELLDLSSNNLEGTIPSFFFQLRNLTSLYLSSNKLFGQMIDLQNVTSPLELLDLSSNNLEGTIPPFFFQLQNLTSLDLSSNKFNGTVHLTKFRNPENIKSLDISDNSLVPQPPRDAEYLDLSSNNFSMIPPDIGDQIPYIFFFSIAKNRVSGRISTFWCRTAHLEVLDLSYNALHGTIPSCLVQNNSNLAVMNLKGNHLSGEISQKFQHSCSLETLDLSQNLLEGQLPPSLVNCTKLKVLNLAKNRISDTFPCWLNKLSNLHILVLHSNHFHGSISCPKLGVNSSWPSLQVIDLSSNNFSGHLPTDLFLGLKAIMVERNEANSKVDYLHFTSQRENFYYQDSVLLGINKPAYPLPTLEEKHSSHHVHIYISVALGFAAGLGGIFVPLLMSNKWRSYYNKKIDGVISKVFFQKACNEPGAIPNSEKKEDKVAMEKRLRETTPFDTLKDLLAI
nr:receptor-like protein 12 [Ipomoea batatas]